MTVYPSEFQASINAGTAIPLVVETPPMSAVRCPNCGGLGTVYVFKLAGQPTMSPSGPGSKWMDLDGRSGWWPGKTDTAPCPICSKGAVKDWIRSQCGLQGGDLYVSLEGFNAKDQTAGKMAALTVARGLLADNRQPKGFLIFTGSFGVGKTHLLMGIVNGFVGIGVYAKYTLLSDLLDEIRDKFGERRGREASTILEHYRSVRVLCIDEIDKVKLSDWALETISKIVVDREQHKDDLLTVMASNITPDQFAPELGYLASRLKGGLVVNVPAPDMRSLGLPKPRIDPPQHWTEEDPEPEPSYNQYNTAQGLDDLVKGLTHGR